MRLTPIGGHSDQLPNLGKGYKDNIVTDSRVKEYYTDHLRKEWRRLAQDVYHQLEFQTTLLETHYRTCTHPSVVGWPNAS